MELSEVLRQLKSKADPRTRKTLERHGASCEVLGVKIGELKKIAARIKIDQPLAEELFATGSGEAMYLAGLIADPKAIRASVLKRWAKACRWAVASEYMVAGVAAESPHGWKLGLEWIDDRGEDVASTGWNTLSGVISTRPDKELDLKGIQALLGRIRKTIHDAPNRVRYTMNGFVIAVGCYVQALSGKARSVAEAIGKIEVDMGDTACKVPFAPAYIEKVVKMGRLGKKRKKARC